MTSRSDMMPTMRSPSTTGSAPIRRSPRLATASLTRLSAPIVATSLPLDERIAAMVIPASRKAALAESQPTLLLTLGAAKGKHARPKPALQSTAGSAPGPVQFDAGPLSPDHEVDGGGVDRRRGACRDPGRERRRGRPRPHDDRDGAGRRADDHARRGADDACVPELVERARRPFDAVEPGG